MSAVISSGQTPTLMFQAIILISDKQEHKAARSRKQSQHCDRFYQELE